ncbi:hypothetical protein [Oleiagrimonas soli]|uniref:Uncharacterized protein n=1 Tax=Oleiagrimonas soli TaxID=1543381 RepID=A0A099CYL8_9GAMM|nr:hypothetical protein [Oleiagrimonas soli]KGI78849.1 hypothetical protein LF63_0102640 [Oleiagrimonas soli]MBB6184356.1 hypothetical protein [Oleiagrimonas soli]
MDKGMFWAVLAALLVFSLIVATVGGVRDAIVGYVMQTSLQHAQRDMAAAAVRQRAEAARQRAQEAARQREALQARTLAPDQQCVSGTVVTVRSNDASQLIRGGAPVRCSGRLAEVPLR